MVALRSIRDEELRVIERRLPQKDSLIGQRMQERDYCIDLLISHAQLTDLKIDELCIMFAEITATIVELHGLFERPLTAVVEVRSGERDIPQCRNRKVTGRRNSLV